MKTPGSVIVISGPSGAGKSTVIGELTKIRNDLYFSVSATTRKMRPGEKDGVNYHFVTQEKFDDMVKNGELLEHAGYADNSYGTPKEPVKDAVREGKSVLLDIEVQGALQVKAAMVDAILVFLIPSHLSDLRQRLLGRSTEDIEVVEKRLKIALTELEQLGKYDYIIFNDDVCEAVKELDSIITAGKCRRHNREALVDKTL